MTDCPHCRSFAEESAKLTDELSGMIIAHRTQGAQLAQARGELRKLDEADPKSADIRTVLSNWQRLTGRKRPAVGPGTKRWKVVTAALKREHGVQGMDGQQRCLFAVEGIALLPYTSAHGRKPSGLPSQRYDDVEHCLGDEKRVEAALRCRALVLGASLNDVELAWNQASATADLYASIVLRLVTRVEQPAVESNVVPIRREGAG